MADGASSISVAVRVRPFTIREAAQLVKTDDGPMFLGDGSLAAAPPKLNHKGLRPVLKVVDERCLVFDPPEDSPMHRFSKSVVPMGKKVKDQTFAFDKVFDDNTTQGDVYEGTTRPLLDSVLEGYNATVFAYGATGCGKTHTITGTAQQPGIIFLTMQELFERVAELQETKSTEISLSYLEIYNETIRDLLVPGGSKQGLMLREDANQAVSVAGLTSHHPQNVQQVMEMIVRGNEWRTMSPTEANATSSRSHAVLQINVASKDRNAGTNEPHTMATLSIIDLAGSERASATKNRGERLIEGANINRSLLALGSCINALCDPRKRNHVPYRNSKLTRLLKFSLGGNCRTVMIVCVSPSSAHYDETQNTLRYANRAKNIQTKVTKNVFNVNRHVKDYLKKIDEQRQMIDELTAKMKDFEGSAYVKFKKQSEKRDGLTKDGITRIRAAYEHAGAERNERTNMMKKLRQIERRISLISAWIAGFDGICEKREDEDPPKSLAAMRKTALGVQAELEGSRQHYHQRIAKNNWERAVDTALQMGVRQLKEAEGSDVGSEIATLQREAELLKSRADREAYTAVLDQERGGDAPIVQVLVQAHFETVAILGQIMAMDEEEAIRTAKDMLGKLVTSSTDVTSQVIKPEGGLPVVEAFPPTHRGTPKRRKPVNLLGPSPYKGIPPPGFLSPARPSLMPTSPSKIITSPRRRKLGPAKKGIQFTPKKKSPVKRGVRWRDDTEDGQLADFTDTPQAVEASPETINASQSLDAIVSSNNVDDSSELNSSPIPAPPHSSLEVKPAPRSSRFQTGFLSKRAENGPHSSPLLPAFSSDSEVSPLREMAANKAPHQLMRSQLHVVSGSHSSDATPNDSEKTSGSGSDEDRSWLVDNHAAVSKIRTAIKRTGTATAGHGHSASVGGNGMRVRTKRINSPPSVLHGRRTSISKQPGPGAAPRRVTMSEDRGRGAGVTGLASGGPVRPGVRAGGSTGSKSAWR
ncbi:uncharacterized protein K452DRAFT_223282 [Aplosporella prunicola CBS 121167]|uniref:Kinesin-like protein n=1 Tax=Aplosporella prunicola CBS 121167 TaxID=1176127 RepID=A0A6A6BLA2_9PEZI|nr:uncharacterized protein K452DRAFT_223282 [Aplosporella prunicola CBS 121167]KAF2144044.1 hypothetical protein K452DRAFT_223282 [Aplosporella prunicola CBS 121167]